MAPRQKPGKSKQDYETPQEFIDAVEARFGPIVCDLAATRDKAKGKAGNYIGPNHAEDGLGTLSPAFQWAQMHFNGVLWLNPEFGDIEPYAEKCWAQSVQRQGLITMLVPGSIGANWYKRWVLGKAFTLGLSPRIQFVGAEQGYPKDLMLCVYGYGIHGHDFWRWKGKGIG